MTSPRVADLVKALVLVLAAFWIYAPAMHGGWVWDDLKFIPQNTYVHDPDRLWKIWFYPQGFIEYYPIEATVQLAQWDLWGENTFGYHVTNVVLHVISALLFWRLLAKIGAPFAWFGSMLFTVHPLMVESVAWIIELKNTLSLVPLLLTMLVYLDYDRERRTRQLVLALLLFLLAMLTKTSGMMFPFVILLYAWWKRGRVGAHDLFASSGFFLISLALGGLSLWIGQFWQTPDDPHARIGLIARLGAVGWTNVTFITKFLFPLGLIPDYPTGIIRPSLAIAPVPWLLLVGLFWLAWSHRRTWGRAAIFGVGFFLINFLTIDYYIMAHYMTMVWSIDHDAYISLLGFCGLAAAGAHYWAVRGSPKLEALVKKALLVIGALLAVSAHIYAGYYLSTDVLWDYAARYFFVS